MFFIKTVIFIAACICHQHACLVFYIQECAQNATCTRACTCTQARFWTTLHKTFPCKCYAPCKIILKTTLYCWITKYAFIYKCSHKAKTPKSEDSRTQRMFTQFRVISENVSTRAKPQAFENYTTISSGLVTCFRRTMKVFVPS